MLLLAFAFSAPADAAAGRHALAPEPVPIDIKYTLGAYYMPKPHDPSHQWTELLLHNQSNAIKPYGQRLPLLGYYQGDSPDVLDWQIKFAVDHGITYFVFDDYWTASRSTPTYEGSLRAFLQARYRRYMQFAVALYSNTTVLDTAEAKRRQFIDKILAYYITHYFNQPNYLLVDNKPAVYIGNLGAFASASARDFAEVLAEADASIRAHTSYAGAYWIAGDPGHADDRPLNFGHVKACGFSAVSPYYVLPGLYPVAAYDQERKCPGWPILVKPDDNQSWVPGVAYGPAVRRAVGLHEASFTTAATYGMKFIPSITLDFDSRWVWWQPRHLYFSGQNAADYEKQLAAVRRLVDKNPGSTALATRTGKPMVGLGAWNEWGESSSIEPGYAALQAQGSRDPFCAVTAIARQFGGPRSYQHPAPPNLSLGWPATTEWTFSTSTGKGPGKWLDVLAVSSLAVEKGDVGDLTIDGAGFAALTAATGASTSDYTRVKIRLDMDRGGPLTTLLLRWQSTEYSERADAFLAPAEPGRKVHDALAVPEQDAPRAEGFRTYTFDLKGRPEWRGRLRSLEFRLAGTSRPAHVRIKRIWLAR